MWRAVCRISEKNKNSYLSGGDRVGIAGSDLLINGFEPFFVDIIIIISIDSARNVWKFWQKKNCPTKISHFHMNFKM